MNVSRRKTAIIFPFRMFLKQKNISLNSIQSAELDKFKIFRKIFQKPVQNWEKFSEVFFLRRRFHLMCQSELKVRANTQF